VKTQNDAPITVHYLSREEPLRFAARELKRYLKAMTGRTVRSRAESSYQPGAAGVWVGRMDAFPHVVSARLITNPHPFDDAIFVTARDGHAVVAGVNPRSVLFAAYRYLEELGCRWFRPGRAGERVPHAIDPLAVRVALEESPSYRHRCICIEGSCSEKHVRAMIDYAAKRGFNAYFFQFRDSWAFFKRWHSQEQPRGRKTTPFSPQDASAICDRLKDEISKRGMIVHRVGHGWTCEPFGIGGGDWLATGTRPPRDVRKYLALVDGRRSFHKGVPINTQLCYSNPRVRTIMARAVADYAETHPDEEVVHFWLADGSNNFCECSRCRDTRPSEFYVMILNDIDELLVERGLSTRVVFLAYVDLLWAPQEQRIKNPDRFILMFAPITRDYSMSFADDRSGTTKVGPYVCNRLEFPTSPRANLKLLRGWVEHFKGDCVDFDYHLWSAQARDPGQMSLAKVLFEDVSALGKLGMAGFISCQLTRVCFPTGIYMHVMGKGLWDSQLSFREETERYFADLFGSAGSQVCSYLNRVSSLWNSALVWGEKRDPASRKTVLQALSKLQALVKRSLPLMERSAGGSDPIVAEAWRLLVEHAWYLRKLAELWGSAVLGDTAEAVGLYQEFEGELRRRLPRFHHVFDTWAATRNIRSLIRKKGVEF